MHPLFTTAFAEETAELSQALEGATKEEALAAGTIMGVSLGIIVTLAIVYYILRVIADWKIFTKAGEPGWKSLIPVYNLYVEYDICWNGLMGLLYAALLIALNLINYSTAPNWVIVVALVLAICALALNIKQSFALARSFGKSTGFAVCLVLFGPICRLILGFGKARYIGRR